MKTLNSYSAIDTARVGTRVRDVNGHTAIRIVGGWVYEASDAPGRFAAWEMTDFMPLTVLEAVALPADKPPVPRVPRLVLSRAMWTPANPSPWVSFTTETQQGLWAREVRRALPGIKVERRYVDLVHTADSLLRVAQAKRKELAP